MFGCRQSILGNANAFFNRHLFHFSLLPQKMEQFQQECTLSQHTFWSDSATVRSCPCWKALFLMYSIPCASWLIYTYRALSSVDRRPYTLFLCWSRLGFRGLTRMLVNTNSNKGMQRESIYTSNDYGTLKNNINEQSVKIHIHECFKNAKNPRTLAH